MIKRWFKSLFTSLPLLGPALSRYRLLRQQVDELHAVAGRFEAHRAQDAARLQKISESLDQLSQSLAHVRAVPELALKAALAHQQRHQFRLTNDLRLYERRITSQNGEDGILAELFTRLGVGGRYFVEFGVETGAECNTAQLVSQGWSGLLIEADPDLFNQLAARYRPHPGVRSLQARVTSANIESLFAEAGVPAQPDLLSIDIDGNDYWVWRAITNYRPRVVVIEYNAFHPPPRRWVMTENPDHVWRGDSYYGASLASLTALGRAKGYTLVACDSAGVNAFFVRDDLLEFGGFADAGALYHFVPFIGHFPHPPGDGPFEEI